MILPLKKVTILLIKSKTSTSNQMRSLPYALICRVLLYLPGRDLLKAIDASSWLRKVIESSLVVRTVLNRPEMALVMQLLNPFSAKYCFSRQTINEYILQDLGHMFVVMGDHQILLPDITTYIRTDAVSKLAKCTSTKCTHPTCGVPTTLWLYRCLLNFVTMDEALSTRTWGTILRTSEQTHTVTIGYHVGVNPGSVSITASSQLRCLRYGNKPRLQRGALLIRKPFQTDTDGLPGYLNYSLHSVSRLVRSYGYTAVAINRQGVYQVQFQGRWVDYATGVVVWTKDEEVTITFEGHLRHRTWPLPPYGPNSRFSATGTLRFHQPHHAYPGVAALSGYFKNVVLDVGTMTYDDGRVFTGQFTTVMYEDVTRQSPRGYSGSQKAHDDALHVSLNMISRPSYGRVTFLNGDSYLTEWQGDVECKDRSYRTDRVDVTQGTYIWPDGASYTGEWENGLMHGVGTFFYVDQSVPDLTSYWTGIWMMGQRDVCYHRDSFVTSCQEDTP